MLFRNSMNPNRHEFIQNAATVQTGEIFETLNRHRALWNLNTVEEEIGLSLI